MEKIRKLLTDLRLEYIQKRDCLVGTLKQDLPPETQSKISYKIKVLTEKINDINDAIVLPESDHE